jgi:hypothetical protein
MKLELLQRLRISSAFSGYSSTYNTANTETGSSASDSLRIPLIGTGLTIDWGDGNVDTGVTSSEASPASHTYSTSGIYTVKVSGGLTQVKYDGNSARDKTKLIDISQWGSIAWTSFNSAFMGCSNVEGSYTDTPNLSGVTDMYRMFFGASIFNSPMNDFDMSNVQTIREIFRSASAFNQPIGSWDTSNLTDIVGMFLFASSFNQPINSWDVTNISNITWLFYKADDFDQDISSWNIVNINGAYQTYNQKSITTTRYDEILIGWEATLQAAHPSGAGYSNGFAIHFNSEYTAGGAAATAKASLISNFGLTISDLGAFNSFVSTYDTTNTETNSSASDSLIIPLIGTQLTIDWGDGSLDTNVTSSEASPASHTYASSGIYTVRTSGNLTQIRYADQRERDRKKLIRISQWGDIAWTSFNTAFMHCSNLEVTATDAPDLSNVTDLHSMFRLARAFNSPINHWDVSNVTSFNRMFYTATAFDQNLDTWDITNVSNMLNFMTQTGVSTANYDAILIGWEATLQAAYPNGTGYTLSINVNFGNSTYTGGGAAATAKASLASTFNMTITDGGIA